MPKGYEIRTAIDIDPDTSPHEAQVTDLLPKRVVEAVVKQNRVVIITIEPKKEMLVSNLIGIVVVVRMVVQPER